MLRATKRCVPSAQSAQGDAGTLRRAQLPYYCFDDGQRPKSKKDLKRQKSVKVCSLVVRDALIAQVEDEGMEDGPNKRAK